MIHIESLPPTEDRWTPERAWEWYAKHGWLCGFNYLPRTAVNSTDMWQRDSFDVIAISDELGWASGYGFNSLRTNLSFIVWLHDKEELLDRIDAFLALCAANNIIVILTLMDDCGFSGDHPFIGEQKAPVPGVHNSQAAASPGRNIVMQPSSWCLVEAYVKAVVARFASDSRVYAWDLYNDPTNRSIFTSVGEEAFGEALEGKSHALMEKAFSWARSVGPSQPLTVGAWHINTCKSIYAHPTDKRAIELSDIITFHAYVRPDHLNAVLNHVASFGRPILCTQWLARHIGSRVEEQLPIFKERGVGCYHWGLVKGKTQTTIPWPNMKQKYPRWDCEWFQDILHDDGKPYNEAEMALFKKLLGKK